MMIEDKLAAFPVVLDSERLCQPNTIVWSRGDGVGTFDGLFVFSVSSRAGLVGEEGGGGGSANRCDLRSD
jgi:hypothetical protein